jgi:hypothetical protein
MTNEEHMAAEIHRLMDCLDNIREMAEARRTVIRINGVQLGNYCRGALSEARVTLERVGAKPHNDKLRQDTAK